jgi:hypothetical protein
MPTNPVSQTQSQPPITTARATLAEEPAMRIDIFEMRRDAHRSLVIDRGRKVATWRDGMLEVYSGPREKLLRRLFLRDAVVMRVADSITRFPVGTPQAVQTACQQLRGYNLGYEMDPD